jgi:hypothetical protein
VYPIFDPALFFARLKYLFQEREACGNVLGMDKRLKRVTDGFTELIAESILPLG